MAEMITKNTATLNRVVDARASGMGKVPRRTPKELFPDPPLLKAVFTHLGYGILIIIGHVLDFLRKLGLKSDPYTEALKNEVCRVLYS